MALKRKEANVFEVLRYSSLRCFLSFDAFVKSIDLNKELLNDEK